MYGRIENSNDKLFENAFFVSDLMKENAEISYKLCKSARQPREKYKITTISNMIESGMSYHLAEIPSSYLKVRKWYIRYIIICHYYIICQNNHLNWPS